MLEPVSLAICSISYAGLGAYARGGSAISPEAHVLKEAATAVVDATERSQVLFGEKSAAISRLRALENECAEVGWDGVGSSPVSWVAVVIAEIFIRTLPDNIPLPEFTVDPDGSVSMDWIISRNRLFSLSTGNNNRLAYAWLDGSDRGHAVARFDGDQIPQRIIDGINTIVGNVHSPVGPL